jgi:hypothetical protein
MFFPNRIVAWKELGICQRLTWMGLGLLLLLLLITLQFVGHPGLLTVAQAQVAVGFAVDRRIFPGPLQKRLGLLELLELEFFLRLTLSGAQTYPAWRRRENCQCPAD